MTCCPSDAETYLGGVTITGHEDHCVHAEPTRYVWNHNGHLHVGTLADYAKSWQHAETAGEREALSELRTWTDSYEAEVVCHGKSDDDWISYELVIGNERVPVTIDGRS